MRDGNAHAHIGGDKLFALNHGVNVASIDAAEFLQQLAGRADGRFLVDACKAGFYTLANENLGLAGLGSLLCRRLGCRCGACAPAGKLAVQGVQIGILQEVVNGD